MAPTFLVCISCFGTVKFWMDSVQSSLCGIFGLYLSDSAGLLSLYGVVVVLVGISFFVMSCRSSSSLHNSGLSTFAYNIYSPCL